MTTENYERPYSELIDMWRKDLRTRVYRRVGTSDHWMYCPHPDFNPEYVWDVRPFDRHAEMKAKYEANPWMYRWRWRSSDTSVWWDWSYPEMSSKPTWIQHYDYEIEKLPHWELRKQIMEEPGKWDVEWRTPLGWVISEGNELLVTREYRLVPKHKPRYISDLERELNAANAEIFKLRNEVEDLKSAMPVENHGQEYVLKE